MHIFTLLWIAPATVLPSKPLMERRTLLSLTAGSVLAATAPRIAVAAPAVSKPSLQFQRASNGLQWAELREGSGAPPVAGQRVTIDYMMTRRGGGKIHSTVEQQLPFEWTLGEGGVIEGLEQGTRGGDGVPPLLMGGVRRLIVEVGGDWF